jgi:hypothetical protein
LLELRFVGIIWLKFALDHVCFTSALLRHPTWLWHEADPASMVCVAAYNCFVFYLIYYVCYGVPKFFVQLDGMQVRHRHSTAYKKMKVKFAMRS